MSKTIDKPPHLEWIQPEYLTIDWGDGGNRAWPKPYVELTHEQWDMRFHHSGYSLRGINYKGNMYLPDVPEELRRGLGGWDLNFYFWHDTALFTARRYMRRDEYDGDKWPKGKGVFMSKSSPAHPSRKYDYGYAVRFFRLGCIHAWKELSQQESRERGVLHHGNCYHVYLCLVCDMIQARDSSG